MDSPKPKRRWVPRYSLRGLLILVTVIAVFLGNHVNEVRKQKEAVAWVEENGGSVYYEFSMNYSPDNLADVSIDYGWEPEFLRNLLGLDFFYDVVIVDLPNLKLSDVSPLVSLKNLEELNLTNTSVNDISPLSSLTNLKHLGLNDTLVNDLSPLASLTNLEELDATGTSVNDISPLSSLTNLKYLGLNDTLVNELSPLVSLKNLEELNLAGTSVSDLSPLVSLKNLEELNLADTSVSDLSPLASLKNLEGLLVYNSKVTKEEIEKLQQALPQCRIFHDFEEEE